MVQAKQIEKKKRGIRMQKKNKTHLSRFLKDSTALHGGFCMVPNEVNKKTKRTITCACRTSHT